MRRHVTLNLTFKTDGIKEWKTRQALNKQLDNNKENMAAHSGIQAALEALSVKHDTEVILINLYVTPYISTLSVTLSSAFVWMPLDCWLWLLSVCSGMASCIIYSDQEWFTPRVCRWLQDDDAEIWQPYNYNSEKCSILYGYL